MSKTLADIYGPWKKEYSKFLLTELPHGPGREIYMKVDPEKVLGIKYLWETSPINQQEEVGFINQDLLGRVVKHISEQEALKKLGLTNDPRGDKFRD